MVMASWLEQDNKFQVGKQMALLSLAGMCIPNHTVEDKLLLLDNSIQLDRPSNQKCSSHLLCYGMFLLDNRLVSMFDRDRDSIYLVDTDTLCSRQFLLCYS